MKTVIEPVAVPVEPDPVEPDLIDRIARTLPEEVRAEYYRELRHCRALPESDEMLRLLRAMQFLVLLIEQAPSRVADERELLEKLLATTVENVRKISSASESYHNILQRKLQALPAEVANGISPEAVAAKINENLRQEFIRSTIPMTAEALRILSERMKNTCDEFTSSSETIGNAYRGAAEDARKAVASMKAEITKATETATRFTNELAEKSSKVYRLSLTMFGCGALVIGLAVGMMFERWLLYTPPQPATQSPAISQPAQPTQSPQPAEQAPSAPKSENNKK